MITQVLVKSGERIKAGQTIATLATADLEGRLAAAKVYLEALVAHRRLLEAARQSNAPNTGPSAKAASRR